ncbi:MAG: YhdT family protein [Ewingella sp.]|uniref:YhdT family protein n=1 Tax=Ewingella TaxID=41201 RepID=UPI00264E4959|nr:YhdT family protein [Ewingella sp.]
MMKTQDTDPRFRQANREARWAFGLTLAYLLAWCLAAYLPDDKQGITGLPHWFEMACLLVPLIFVLLSWLMVRVIYRDISLEDTPHAD